MNEERLTKIEKKLKYTLVIDELGKELFYEVINALRSERQKVADLENKIKSKNNLLLKATQVYNDLPLEYRQNDKTIIFIGTALME